MVFDSEIYRAPGVRQGSQDSWRIRFVRKISRFAKFAPKENK